MRESGARSTSTLLDDRHDILLAHHHELLVVDFHLGAAVLPEQHPISDFHIEGSNLAVLQDFALTHGNDLPESRFLARGVGDHDPARGLTLLSFPLDDHTVLQGTDVHKTS